MANSNPLSEGVADSAHKMCTFCDFELRWAFLGLIFTLYPLQNRHGTSNGPEMGREVRIGMLEPRGGAWGHREHTFPDLHQYNLLMQPCASMDYIDALHRASSSDSYVAY
jgi:hypothetical protein